MRRLAIMVMAGCVYAPPQSFSSGTRWTFPLVDPLRDGKLLVPVTVDGRGPYLFAIDPEAAQTALDREVVTDNWGQPLDPKITVANVVIGTLTISELDGVVVDDKNGKFDGDGRRVFGVIGRDVLTDQLAFGFDRERGIAWLQRFDDFHAGSALPLRYEDAHGERVVTASLGATAVRLAIELGDMPSQLRRDRWDACKLDPKPAHGQVVDHAGARRDVTEIGVAAGVEVGGLHRDGLGFLVYDGSSRADGTLGLDFFRPFVVTLAPPAKALYLARRAPSPDSDRARLARWGTQMLDACKAVGCVTVEVVRTERDDGSERVDLGAGVAAWRAGLTNGPSEIVTFQATRDPASAGNDLQVVLAATGSDGRELPRLEVELPAGVDAAAAPGDARYAGATLRVVDVSPFPRACPGRATGCIERDPSASAP